MSFFSSAAACRSYQLIPLRYSLDKLESNVTPMAPLPLGTHTFSAVIPSVEVFNFSAPLPTVLLKFQFPQTYRFTLCVFFPLVLKPKSVSYGTILLLSNEWLWDEDWTKCRADTFIENYSSLQHSLWDLFHDDYHCFIGPVRVLM